jgi:hypothetical protein
MLDAKPLGHCAHGRPSGFGQASNCEQELVLLGLDARAARRLLAKNQKFTDLVAERSQSAVVR